MRKICVILEDFQFDPEQFRLPRKGDRLLRKPKDWNHGAEFSQHSDVRDVAIWDGYMNAGDALVQISEQSPSERNILIYPLLFNYRHGVELAIKWIIKKIRPSLACRN